MPSNDNYSVRDYGRMIADEARTRPYLEALRRAVRPGSVVLDIGTGPGLFALFACRLGAARVYAVEPDDAIAIGQECARRQPGGDGIVWLRGLSTEIELPERVDVVIGDLHGTLPMYSSNLVSLLDARRRHLKPGGVMIPCRDTVYAVPTEADDEYACVIKPWQMNIAGIDLQAGRRYVVNQWWRAATPAVGATRFLAEPRSWAQIDYRSFEATHVSGDCEWTATRAGVMHGYYVWFDGETFEGEHYSNSPTLPELVYGRAFFPLERPQTLTRGDRIHFRIAAHPVRNEYIFGWNTRIEDSEGRPSASFAQSNFHDRPLLREDVARARPDHRPSLNDPGRVDLSVLQGLSAGLSLGEIADGLAREFPSRFGDAATALRYVADLSLKYSRS